LCFIQKMCSQNLDERIAELEQQLEQHRRHLALIETHLLEDGETLLGQTEVTPPSFGMRLENSGIEKAEKATPGGDADE